MTNLPPEHVLDALEEAQRLRGWIASGYAQIEYLLRDIILKAFAMAAYKNLVVKIPRNADGLIKVVKTIVEASGYFLRHQTEILWILSELELHRDKRNMFAHGYLTIVHTPNREVGFQFRKWNKNGVEEITTIQLIEFQYLKSQTTHASERTAILCRNIHSDLESIAT